MPLINCEINLILTWSTDCVISSAADETKYAVTDTKPNVPIVTLSTKYDANCLNNYNMVLKEQLTGININQRFQQKDKTNI